MNIQLTSEYRLVDKERDIVLQRLVTIDPTKAPSWAARKAADPTLSAELKTEWRDDGYYSQSVAGVKAAISCVAVRSIGDDVTDVKTLNAYLKEWTPIDADACAAIFT